MTQIVKDEELFSELESKSSNDRAKIVEKHIANKEYKADHLKELGKKYINDVNLYSGMLNGFKSLKDSADKITEKQKEAYEETVSGFNAVLSDPNASEELKSKAIKASVDCYKLFTASLMMIFFTTFLTAAVVVIATIFNGSDKQNKQLT